MVLQHLNQEVQKTALLGHLCCLGIPHPAKLGLLGSTGLWSVGSEATAKEGVAPPGLIPLDEVGAGPVVVVESSSSRGNLLPQHGGHKVVVVAVVCQLEEKHRKGLHFLYPWQMEMALAGQDILQSRVVLFLSLLCLSEDDVFLTDVVYGVLLRHASNTLVSQLVLLFLATLLSGGLPFPLLVLLPALLFLSCKTLHCVELHCD